MRRGYRRKRRTRLHKKEIQIALFFCILLLLATAIIYYVRSSGPEVTMSWKDIPTKIEKTLGEAIVMDSNSTDNRPIDLNGTVKVTADKLFSNISEPSRGLHVMRAKNPINGTTKNADSLSASDYAESVIKAIVMDANWSEGIHTYVAPDETIGVTIDLWMAKEPLSDILKATDIEISDEFFQSVFLPIEDVLVMLLPDETIFYQDVIVHSEDYADENYCLTINLDGEVRKNPNVLASIATEGPIEKENTQSVDTEVTDKTVPSASPNSVLPFDIPLLNSPAEAYFENVKYNNVIYAQIQPQDFFVIDKFYLENGEEKYYYFPDSHTTICVRDGLIKGKRNEISQLTLNVYQCMQSFASSTEMFNLFMNTPPTVHGPYLTWETNNGFVVIRTFGGVYKDWKLSPVWNLTLYAK